MTNIKTMMEEMAQEELERDGAACVEVMQSRKGAGTHDSMRLIDANAMRQEWLENGENEYVYDTNAVLDSIDEQPTVDAELVHYGRWVTVHRGNNNYVECSECHTVGSPFWKRCPLCEAKMKGEKIDAVD